MPVPTESSTRKELQEYITSHKLNIKKNQNKGPLLKAIRAAGHRGGKKPPPVPYNVKGKRVINPKTGKARKRAENADTAILGASPGPAAAKAKAMAKKSVPKGSHKMPDGSIMKDKDMKSSKNEKEKATPKKTPTKGRTYQYTVYLPEDYSDSEALDYWEASPLVSSKSGVNLGKELTAEGGRPIYEDRTYHVFTAKKLHTVSEWKTATKGRPSGFVSDTGQNYGYTGGIVKKLK